VKEKTYIVEVNGGRNFRPATEEEITTAKKTAERIDELWEVIKAAEEERDRIHKTCAHTVVHNKDGYVWTMRTCLACGNVDLI